MVSLACPAQEGMESSDTIRMTVVEIAVHDLQAWSPWYDEPSGNLYVVQKDPDGPERRVGGVLVDGASGCVVRLEPPIIADDEHPLVEEPEAMLFVIRQGDDFSQPSVVGTLRSSVRRPTSPGPRSFLRFHRPFRFKAPLRTSARAERRSMFLPSLTTRRS